MFILISVAIKLKTVPFREVQCVLVSVEEPHTTADKNF